MEEGSSAFITVTPGGKILLGRPRRRWEIEWILKKYVST